MTNVEVHGGELERLPLNDASLDIALLGLVLHYLPDPPRVLAEAHRVLKPGGRVVVVDMLPHERQDLRQTMGHVWPGFSAEQMQGWLNDAGFHAIRVRPLPSDPDARGPGIMVAVGVRPA
jgi:ArsR family transcriptional regulator